MSLYVYEKPRQSTSTWIKIIAVLLIATALVTGMIVSHRSSSKIAELENTIKQMEQKEIYYKEIEQQFFKKQSEEFAIERYEAQLKQKDEQITALSDYIEELSEQAAALENTVKKQAITTKVYPQNYIPPTTVSRGSYDRLRRNGTELIDDKLEYVGEWLMTMYTPTKEECGNNKGITASGVPVQPGQNIAIDPRYWNYGQKFYIEGYGYVVATDKGSAIKGRNRLDYCVLDPELAKQFGSKKVKVWLVKEDEE